MRRRCILPVPVAPNYNRTLYYDNLSLNNAVNYIPRPTPTTAVLYHTQQEKTQDVFHYDIAISETNFNDHVLQLTRGGRTHNK